MVFIFLDLVLSVQTITPITISHYQNFATSYETGNPIQINNDADFISQGWPGAGTHEDSFIADNLPCRNLLSSNKGFPIQS